MNVGKISRIKLKSVTYRKNFHQQSNFRTYFSKIYHKNFRFPSLKNTEIQNVD